MADSSNERVLYFTTPTAPPRILTVGLNPAGQFFLTFESSPSAAYEIHTSGVDLTFSKVADITANSTTTTWTEPATANGRKFFRIVIP